jgi:hypothetical protein
MACPDGPAIGVAETIGMPNLLRQFLLLFPPLAVGALNLTHPIVHLSIYSGILHHLNWWIGLHLLNLFGFPLVGLAAY